MNKYTVIAIAIIIIAGLIWGFGFKNADDKAISNSSCIQAGEVYENPSLGPQGNFGECCLGLVGISQTNVYNENCEFSGIVGSGKICSDCGNGVCESWESKCNCVKDCA